MRHVIPAAVLAAVLAGPALAQESRVAGTVAEVFGRQVVVVAPEGRLLLTLPEGSAAPRPGAQVEASGLREGQTFAARSLRVTAEAPPMGGPGAVLPGAAFGPLADFGMTDALTRTEFGRHGREVVRIGRLPQGGWMRLKWREGRLVEAETDGAPLPEAAIAALLPPAIRNDPALGQMRHFIEIDIERQGEIEVKGPDAQGRIVEAEFFPSGGLRKLEIEYDRGRPWIGFGPSARERLAALGYRDIAFVRQGGRHVEAVARNPYGEWVEVRVNDRGQVDRERMWSR